MVTVAQRLSLVTLCSLTMGENCPNIVVTKVMVEGEAPDAGEATAAPKEEMDSQSTIDPSLVGW